MRVRDTTLVDLVTTAIANAHQYGVFQPADSTEWIVGDKFNIEPGGTNYLLGYFATYNEAEAAMTLANNEARACAAIDACRDYGYDSALDNDDGESDNAGITDRTGA